MILTQEVFLTQEHFDNNFSSRMFFDSRILYFIKKQHLMTLQILTLYINRVLKLFFKSHQA
jgi:hypothetical protein